MATVQTPAVPVYQRNQTRKLDTLTVVLFPASICWDKNLTLTRLVANCSWPYMCIQPV